MNYRAWLNDDPASNETIDFIMPPGSQVTKLWEIRIDSYLRAKQRHIDQYYKEIIALKLVCNQYRLPKDMFNLLKNKYIQRPVEKPQPKNANSNLYASVVISIAFLLYLAVVMSRVVMQPMDVKQYVMSWDCETTNNKGVPTCIPTFQFSAGPPGAIGPPGVCGERVLQINQEET